MQLTKRKWHKSDPRAIGMSERKLMLRQEKQTRRRSSCRRIASGKGGCTSERSPGAVHCACRREPRRCYLFRPESPRIISPAGRFFCEKRLSAATNHLADAARAGRGAEFDSTEPFDPYDSTGCTAGVESGAGSVCWPFLVSFAFSPRPPGVFIWRNAPLRLPAPHRTVYPAV